MKKILFLLFIGVSCFASAQNEETLPGDSIPWELRKQAFIYSTAKSFNDPVVARTALYNILAINPANVSIYDSLAIHNELVTLEGFGHGAWNAVVDGKGLSELTFDFLVERQNLNVE